MTYNGQNIFGVALEPILESESTLTCPMCGHVKTERLKEYGMICSMSRKGNCWDNAPTENFFNSYKNERVHGTRYECAPLGPLQDVKKARACLAFWKWWWEGDRTNPYAAVAITHGRAP